MGMNRRDLVAGLGTAALGLAAAQARASERRPVTVLVFMRGAVDGLNVVVPYADADYYRLRPSVRVPEPGEDGGVLPVDDLFGLHPALEPLLPFWNAGRMAAVHAAGSPHDSRSHFDAQAIMEAGVQDESATLSGWMGRYLARAAGTDSPFRAVALASAAPRSLQGPVPPLALQNFDIYNAILNRGEDFLTAIEQLHGFEALLDVQGRLAIAALRQLQAADPAAIEPRNGAQYPNTGFARSLQKAAQLIHANLGCEVITVDIGGWDTHVGQNGALSNRLAELAGGLAAFMTDLGQRMDDTHIMTMSEFGRRASQNGSGGTDHGHGNVMLAFGGGINGGQVLRDWPGLGDEDLDRGDLQVTTDYRAVLSEYLNTRLQGAGDAFPDFVPAHSLRLFRPA